MSISSDEINFLIFRYLSENGECCFKLQCISLLLTTILVISTGFSHSAFTFAHESLVVKSSTAQTEIPPGALITFLQKGLEYIAIEEHINEVRACLWPHIGPFPLHMFTFDVVMLLYQDGSIQDYDNNFSLLSPLICEAIAVKEDRRSRRTVPQSSANTGTAGAAAGSAESMDVVNDASAGADAGASDTNAISSSAPSSHQLV